VQSHARESSWTRIEDRGKDGLPYWILVEKIRAKDVRVPTRLLYHMFIATRTGRRVQVSRKL
jgi:hypothetical protein